MSTLTIVLLALAAWSVLGAVAYAVLLKFSDIMDELPEPPSWLPLLLAGPLVWLVALAAWWGGRK